jgi:hypothetical protein
MMAWITGRSELPQKQYNPEENTDLICPTPSR